MSTATPPAPRASVAYTLVLVGALGVQVLVLVSTFFMGLGWGGPTWLAGLAQSGAAVGLVVWLGNRRSWWVAAVPVASALLTAGLVVSAEQYAAATECNDRERAAFGQLSPPAGVALELGGEMANGCLARGSTDTPPTEIVDHYAGQLREHGWTLGDRQPTYLAADRDGLRITVDVPVGEGGMVLVSIWDPADT